MEPKRKYILLLPLRYNDGREVHEVVQESILDAVYQLADGYTIGSTVTGAYRMKDGSKQMDRLQEIWMLVDAVREPLVRPMVAKFAAMLEQEVMFLERTDSSVDFVPPDVENGGDT